MTLRSRIFWQKIANINNSIAFLNKIIYNINNKLLRRLIMYLKKFKKVTICIILVLLLFSSSILPYNAKELISQTTNTGWIPDSYIRLGSTINSDSYGLPSLYDPRNEIYLTDGKDQAYTDLCWLFAAVGAIEQKTSKSYGSKFDLSEAHAATALSNLIIPNNYSGSGYYDHRPNMGGNSARALQYFTNWNTPVFLNETCQWNASVSETDYPITKIFSNEPMNNDFINADSVLNVTDAKYIENNINSIKQAIQSNGAVVAAMDTLNTYYGVDENNDFNYFRSSASISAQHAVVFVGWNDSYSKENFIKSKPSSDGAWLVRNSYKDHQYFWLSYEEGSIENNFMTIEKVQKNSNKERMLSYDYYPVGYTENSFSDTVYLCNVFDVSDYTDTYDKINKVMLYLRSTGCTYEVKITQPNIDGDLPLNFNNYTTLAEGEFSGEGYITANLDIPYSFTSNKKCAIVIKLIPNSNNSQIYIPFEGKFQNANKVFLSPELNIGESYYGFENNNNVIEWKDCCIQNQYGIVGNLIIRPVLKNSDNAQSDINVSPTEIVDSDTDININFNDSVNLFNVHTLNNYILRQDVDYIKTTSGITLKSDYISSLNREYTELILEFNNDIKKTVVINPKSIITDIKIIGKPIVGDSLKVECVGNPPKNSYDINYQWQISPNGISWYDITNANTDTYSISENEYDLFIRVKVTSKSKYGNVIYPFEKYSPSTDYKVVVLGDVNLDGEITINDATILSKYLAELISLNERQLLAADFNKDGVISVSDVTCIQQIAMQRK